MHEWSCYPIRRRRHLIKPQKQGLVIEIGEEIALINKRQHLPKEWHKMLVDHGCPELRISGIDIDVIRCLYEAQSVFDEEVVDNDVQNVKRQDVKWVVMNFV